MITQDTNTLPTQNDKAVVNSYNEWDLLEEVIVGRIEKSIHPPQHIVLLGGIPQKLYNLLFWVGGSKVSYRGCDL